jgi:pimeloyl-ACP methyl ester carboxylesterase
MSAKAPLTSAVLFVPESPMMPAWWRVLRRVAVVGVPCLLVWLLQLGLLWTYQSRLVFMTSMSRELAVAPVPAPFRGGQLHTADGLTLRSVALTHEDARDRYWVLFCLPAGGSLAASRIQNHLHTLWNFGYDILAFEYRGFGANAGRPSEPGLYLDALAAYEHLTRDEGVPPSRIILAGRSLGTAVAVDLATRVDAGGLLLFSAIDSVPLTGARLYPWLPVRWLAAYQFDSLSKARRVDLPVVIVQGYGDDLVPLPIARSLFAAFRGPKQMIETAGGHDVSGFVKGSPLYETLDRFWPISSIHRR